MKAARPVNKSLKLVVFFKPVKRTFKEEIINNLHKDSKLYTFGFVPET
jgi:hypothetical protein